MGISWLSRRKRTRTTTTEPSTVSSTPSTPTPSTPSVPSTPTISTPSVPSSPLPPRCPAPLTRHNHNIMDVPSSTPRRLPPRNSQQHNAPKHIADIFPPTQPAPLHTRGNGNGNGNSAVNETWDPQPTAQEFTAGAGSNLGEMLDRSLQLEPSTPTWPQPTPSKRHLQAIHEDDNSGIAGETSIIRLEDPPVPHRHNKENAPPKGEQVQPQPQQQQTPGRGGNTGGLQRSYAQRSGRTYDPFRDMTIDEIEKLSKPQVKRLKDVAHLCRGFLFFFFSLFSFSFLFL